MLAFSGWLVLLVFFSVGILFSAGESSFHVWEPSFHHWVSSKEEGEASSALPPQGVDPLDDSSPSHASESPIKRRPGTN